MIHNWENYFDISSEYWKKAERIYEENESFPKKVVKDRNLHHKFPRSFSKKDGGGGDIDNDKDNLVSLSLADHFRVHYYLWKCAKKGYRGMMALAFTLMRKKVVIYASDETIEQLAKDYEEAMKEAAEALSEAMKGHSVSEETKKKIAEANKGKHIGADNSFYGRHHSDNTRNKLSEINKGKHIGADNPFYGKHHTDEAKKKMSKARKGKYAGETHPMYGKHHADEAKKKMSEAHKGKHLSEEHKNKIGEASKGRRWFNNGEKCVRAKECPPGFVPGRIK